MRKRARRIVSFVAILIGFLGSSGGCELVQQDRSMVPMQVGDLQLQRNDDLHQRYRLTLSIYNGTAAELTGFTLSSRVTAPVDPHAGGDGSNGTDSSDGDADDPGDTEVEAAMHLSTRCRVSADTASTVELVFPSPFPFVPASPIELSRIGLSSFEFSDGTAITETISYPYLVKEVP